ncbi:39S ribosomal protein L43, mitochondrial [Anthonomus grandis grandis]|uniref:39S ribosomal protein L43, mitochondrial n=1 Tax=Anthonomus grandis grandis TaxID=2921223 RepID=UPI00216654D0|nr:39S ribosomal protein L43, mitochondrial [Anthonomus grandis grandis]XP_050309218.1 39S ribosomal protein L43, mitochondrial [Anthonomus grandis grandis]
MSNSHLFLKPAFIRTPGQNGVGRYICQLQRVVLKFCMSSGASRGMREFIETRLINFVNESPEVAVYMKPRRHRTPIIKAEYLNGDTQWVNARNFTEEEVLKWLKLLKSQSTDRTGIRLRKLLHTDHPSIQGPWTPYTFRDPKLNLATFPDENLSGPELFEKSATEQLMEMFEKQKIAELEGKRAE